MKTEGPALTTLISYARLAVISRWTLLGLSVLVLPVLDWLGWLGPALLPLVALALIAASYNLILHLLLRHWARRGHVPRRRLEAARRASSLADLTILVGLIYLTGGPHSPFYALFLLAFVFLGLVGRTTEPLLYGVLVLVLLSGMFAAEHAGVVPHFGFGPGGRGPGDLVPAPPLLVGILAYWTLLTAAAFVLVHLVRREIRDRELRLIERRRQLTEAEAFQGRVLEVLPVGIVVFGAGGRIARLNPVATALLEAADPESNNLLRLPRVIDSGLSGFVERLVGGEPLELDSFPCVVPGRGKPLWLRLRGVPPRTPADGYEEPGILLIEDISALKERDDREAVLQEQLFQADKLASLGQLASGVAHELNNPLTAIVGTAQLVAYMLREGHSDAADLGQRLEHIQVHGKRIEGLIRSLLAYARPSREEPRALPLKPLVDELLVFAEFELKRDAVELQVDVPADLPDFLCAKTELQQLMLNLLTNARHVVPHDSSGRIELSLSTQQVDGRQMLRIVVRDNGPGISGDLIERVFEPFFSTKDPSLGTGLGLAIVNAIVERYCGAIHIETELGAGTAFIVDLPYHDKLPATQEVGDATFSPYS